MSKSSITTRPIATPNRVTAHPGEVLNEEVLKPLRMSVNALAMALRVPATRIGAIVKGERAVTADTALRLARFYGTSPEFWMNLQAMHDLTKARMESGAAFARDVRPRAAYHRILSCRTLGSDIPDESQLDAFSPCGLSFLRAQAFFGCRFRSRP
jgi:antitoxin HigA-1